MNAILPPVFTFTPSSNPGYRLFLQRGDGYLRALVSGPYDSVAISLAYWRELTAECRRLGYRKLLVLEHLGRDSMCMRDPSVEYYLVACELPEITRGIRVAFVDANSHELEANRLGESIATSRGADTRLFHTEEAAIAWLMTSNQ